MTENNGETWQIYPGDQITSLALPDYYSIYLSYTFNTSDHPNTGLRIKGEFPFARYMSFNIYTTRVGTSLGSLTDYQIKTPIPNDNPFVAGGNPQPLDRHYLVYVQQKPDDGPSPDQTPTENLLTYDPNDLLNPDHPEEQALLTVVIRYYVPEGVNGGVPLPEVGVYPVGEMHNVTAAPPTFPTHMYFNEPIFRERLKPIFDTISGDQLRFYHAGGKGQFNNADNLYLISAVDNVDGHDNVLMLRILPPSFPRSSNEEFDKAIVRYWSINQGNPNTSTPLGMRDGVFLEANDRYVYVVLGDDNVRSAANAGGYNFMYWKANQEQAVILYRNMLTIPQYRGSIARVPQLPTGPWGPAQLDAYEAARFLSNYAPKGQKVTAENFNKSYGGWPAPGFLRDPPGGD